VLSYAPPRAARNAGAIIHLGLTFTRMETSLTTLSCKGHVRVAHRQFPIGPARIGGHNSGPPSATRTSGNGGAFQIGTAPARRFKHGNEHHRLGGNAHGARSEL
jgi:hypothetical protein